MVLYIPSVYAIFKTEAFTFIDFFSLPFTSHIFSFFYLSYPLTFIKTSKYHRFPNKVGVLSPCNFLVQMHGDMQHKLFCTTQNKNVTYIFVHLNLVHVRVRSSSNCLFTFIHNHCQRRNNLFK